MVNINNDYHNFVKKINKLISIDLNDYKETQMKRRLTTLRDKLGFKSFEAYYQALAKDPKLMDEFKNRITINVTEFFRNPERWKVLQNTYIPALIKNKNQLTIWSAACSTGEEPYSLAMMMQEHFPRVKTEIIATDIDQKALATAKKGIYSEHAIGQLSLNYQQKYFTQTGDNYKINRSVKQNISFKQHNLLADPYPKNVDLIVCRNVLIYFTEPAKKEIYLNFSNSLRKDGVLFVGSTEQIFSPATYNLKLAETFFYLKNSESL